MIRLPIGEYFDVFVNWLKATFSGLFDFISALLNFSIDVLENTLLLNELTGYASILFGLLLFLVAGLLGRRLGGRKLFLPFAIVAALVFGGLETWRTQNLAAKVTPEVASAMETDFSELRESLAAEFPADFSAAQTLVNNIREAIPEEDEEARRDVARASRSIRTAREGEVDEIYDALSDTREAIAVDPVEEAVPQALQSRLDEAINRYRTFTAVDEADRLIDDLKRVEPGDDYELRNQFINARSYERLVDVLGATEAYYGGAGNQQIADEAAGALQELRLLNPDRLQWLAPVFTIILLAIVAYLIASGGVAVFAVIGLLLVISINLWVPTMETLALVLSATLFALLVGIPLGILAARSDSADKAIRPVLDFMQTMPAFVYLIPAVIFFGLGKVPGAMATLIFSMPPAVRLTNLGIRQVPEEVVEAAQAFGATPRQMLLKAQLPIAMITILAGVNQTIMLALSMVVIGGMIGAGGLGEVVLSGITQLKLGLGFEGGVAVVILAIYLDRVTQALGAPKTKPKK